MIQLYKADNTNYEFNGDRIIFPLLCQVRMELNGVWDLELEHPIDQEGVWQLIVKEAVLSVPTTISKRQLYRIYSTVKTDDLVKAYARPIFFDAAHDVMLMNTVLAGKNGQEALNIMTHGSRYQGVSDIILAASSEYVRINLIEALSGDGDQSFLNRWGGEIIYDNYKVIINKRVGGDHGVQIRTGKNLSGVKEEVHVDQIITRIIPVAYNNYTLDGAQPWVDSPLIDNYPIIYTKVVKFEDIKLAEDAGNEEDGFETEEALRAELIRRSQMMYQAGADLPQISYDIDMIYLANTEDYKDFTTLEQIGLGDLVYCRHRGLDITTSARAVAIEYDCIGQKVKHVSLGDIQYDYFKDLTGTVNAVKQVISPKNELMAEKVTGILDGMNTQLYYQKNRAKRQDVRAILFEDTDPESELYGALCIGSQGLQISKKRTSDNREWDWTTAATAHGIYAGAVITGLLADKTGRSFWDLDTGQMQLSGTFQQFAANGLRSVRIRNNQIMFYDWQEDGIESGSIASTRNRVTEEMGLSIGCNNNTDLHIGVFGEPDERGVRSLSPYLSIRDNEPVEMQLFKSLSLNNRVMFIAKDKTSAIYGANSNDGRTVIGGESDIVLGKTTGTYGGEITTQFRLMIGDEITAYRNLNMNGYSIIGQSDERLKKNIKDVKKSGLDAINALGVKEFDWIESGKHVAAGLIAQELKEVLPDCVTELEEGVMATIPMNLIYWLIKAVQELSDKVESSQRRSRHQNNYTYSEKLKFSKEHSMKGEEETIESDKDS